MTFTPTRDQLPATVPLFPLEGAVLLPGGDLPLNIFEPRYLAMVQDALAGDRLIGMIQPCPCPEKTEEGARPFYKIGCVGRISSFEETRDGRYLVNLTGVSRFNLVSHKLNEKGYREAKVCFVQYAGDFNDPEPLAKPLTRSCLLHKFQEYLQRNELFVDWEVAKNIPDHRFYTLLAMICPFSPAEKQALLEAKTFEERCSVMKCLMDIACAEEEKLFGKDLPC